MILEELSAIGGDSGPVACPLSDVDVSKLGCSDKLSSDECRKTLLNQPWLCFDPKYSQDCARTCYLWRLYNPEVTSCDVNNDDAMTGNENPEVISGSKARMDKKFSYCGYNEQDGWMINCFAAGDAAENDVTSNFAAGSSCFPMSYFGDSVIDCSNGIDEDLEFLKYASYILSQLKKIIYVSA